MPMPGEDRSFTFREWLGLPPPNRAKVSWWQPKPHELLRQAGLGCWTILLLPLAVGGALILLAFLVRQDGYLLGWLGVRVLILWLIVPVFAYEHLRLRAMRRRADPYCVHCGYTLRGLPEEGKCPECGRAFRKKIVEIFRRDPQWVMAWWRFNGRPPSLEEFARGHRLPF